MSTSGLYGLSNFNNFKLIQTAYSMVSKDPSLLVLEDIVYASSMGNLMMSHWANRGLNLWTVKQNLLTLSPGVPQYTLPIPNIDILEASLRTSSRMIGNMPPGEATSTPTTGGNALEAFDNDIYTACTQTAPNGWVKFNYGLDDNAQPIKNSIQMLGIQSYVDAELTLKLEGSNDDVLYYPCGNYPLQSYAGVTGTPPTQSGIVWLPVFNQAYYQYFKLSALDGSTLNISELYLNSNCTDTKMTALSRSQYLLLPTKYNQSRPNLYYIDRQEPNPVLNIYQSPSASYNCLIFNSKNTMQDFGDLTDIPQIPQRFYLAFVTELAYWMSLRIAPERSQEFETKSGALFTQAALEDREKNINTNISFSY